MQLDDAEESAFGHKMALRISFAKDTLEHHFPNLALMLDELSNFRPSMLKEGQRQKGTFCVVCFLKEIQHNDLLSTSKFVSEY